jgi:hypothetical protein
MFGVQRTVPVAEFDGLQQANIWQRPEPPERTDNYSLTSLHHRPVNRTDRLDIHPH